jgi:chemotaxis protein methyltransferase CheR
MSSGTDSAYRILMGLLEARTGQTLSPGRIWRIEMSLKPVLQQHKLEDMDQLVAALVNGTDRSLLDDVIDAMLNNETFFFREHLLFDEIATAALEQLRQTNAATR